MGRGAPLAATLVTLTALAVGCAGVRQAPPSPGALDPATLPFVRKTDDRFQSFQVGMSHLTGRETWKTYDAGKGEGAATQPDSFGAIREARAPTDLGNRRLRNLAAALGPFYVRYGGTTTNSVYFDNSDTPPPARAPAGFQTILTRERWKEAIDFAKAVDARIVTGFTVSDGVRDATGAWTPAHAKPWLAYTRAIGGEIVAAELYNEPNAREPGRTEEPESTENYARDFAALAAFRDIAAPGLKLAGPGTAMLGLPAPIAALESVTAEQYMSADPKPRFDVVSYHFYGALAERCAQPDSPAGVSAQDALTEEWLARPDKEFEKFRALRDQHAPGAPIWLTETGTAACGGTRWQPTFLDTFHFLDRQARLAKQGLDVIVTHALISGSNGIIDEKTFQPNADYWAALLWKRLMGAQVLDTGPIEPGFHVYAHCTPDRRGAVTLLAINNGTRDRTLESRHRAEIYALSSDQPETAAVRLNGQVLMLDANDNLPAVSPVRSAGRAITVPARTISFVMFPTAGNVACR